MHRTVPELPAVLERPVRPVRATRSRAPVKAAEPSTRPVASSIAAIMNKASRFGFEIPPFPTEDRFPEEIPGVPVHGSDLAPSCDLVTWQAELRDSWRHYASANIAHNALLAEVEVSKQRIADADERRRQAWAAWCYLQGVSLLVNPPDSPPPRKKSKGQGKGKGKGKARAGSSDESDDGGEESCEDSDGDGDENEGAGAAGGSSMDVS